MFKPLTLSIVIPVYNEEHHIKDCLDAVTRQTVKPFEVVVVDNNCTDDTIKIARRYPFVRVVKEHQQGRGHARSRGFDEAKGSIIGRIDADSKIAPDWAERVLKNFEDKDLDGLTGLGLTNTIPSRIIPSFYSTLWTRVYYWSTHADTRVMTMWGANMALRRSAWRRVRGLVCLDDKLVHEDIDVSLAVVRTGGKVIQDNKLLIKTKGQSYHYFPKLVEYTIRRIRTWKIHRRQGYMHDPKIQKISLFQAERWRLYSFLPGVAFILVSLLLWPLDEIMLRVPGVAHKWLD